MAVEPTHSPETLIQFIKGVGENSNVDAKGPCYWDLKDGSARLAKDIVAFSNSRDGGVIVVGKSQRQDKQFDFVGVTPEQARTFDTTEVAKWVNKRFAPAVHLTCYAVEFENKLYVVIAVEQFADVPAICVKQYDSQDKDSNIRLGAIYVRTANATSEPVSSIEEWRKLIGLATANRGDEFVSHVRAMFTGRPLVPERPKELVSAEQFANEFKRIASHFDPPIGEPSSIGDWLMTIRPAVYNEDRWTLRQLKEVVERSTVLVRNSRFPGMHDPSIEEWGIHENFFDQAFALTKAGLFVARRQFREDTRDYRNPWQPNPDIPKGQWLEFQWAIADVTEMFMFAARLAKNFEIGEAVYVEIKAGPLRNRLLVTLNGRLTLHPTEPSKASSYSRKIKLLREEFVADAEKESANTLYELFEYLKHRIELDTITQWIERFKTRKFYD
jgi:hypothetical protein